MYYLEINANISEEEIKNRKLLRIRPRKDGIMRFSPKRWISDPLDKFCKILAKIPLVRHILMRPPICKKSKGFKQILILYP